jgi:hypothetical protein
MIHVIYDSPISYFISQQKEALFSLYQFRLRGETCQLARVERSCEKSKIPLSLYALMHWNLSTVEGCKPPIIPPLHSEQKPKQANPPCMNALKVRELLLLFT